MRQGEFNFIDLFAGAGGLTEGFLNNDFFPLAHIEMNRDACKTLKTRLAYHFLKKQNKLNIYNKYLVGKISQDELFSHVDKKIVGSVINQAISEENMSNIFSTIDERINLECAGVDVVVGGPPCQAYSLVGRSVQGKKVKRDERNGLYKLYIRFLEKYKPKVFVFENVDKSVEHGSSL